MPGERFSVLYLCAGEPTPDSDRARRRVGALFHEPVFSGHIERLASYCGQDLGISSPDDGKYPSHWHRFVRECRISQFLDAITMVYRYLFWHVNDNAAIWWRDTVRKIVSEEGLAYDIDNVCGIHPKVDREFQRNMASAVAGLDSDQHQGVRDLLTNVEKNLGSHPPNYKQAWRAIASAVELLFGQIFPYATLTADEVERRLLPLIRRAYEGDPMALKAAEGMVAAFQGWVEASRIYRYQPGVSSSESPPADVSILLISNGASLMRWLLGFDNKLAA